MVVIAVRNHASQYHVLIVTILRTWHRHVHAWFYVFVPRMLLCHKLHAQLSVTWFVVIVGMCNADGSVAT